MNPNTKMRAAIISFILFYCAWSIQAVDLSSIRSFLVPRANAKSASGEAATSPHQSEKELKEGIANFYDKVCLR